jgi:hypothetical protein
MVFLKKLSKLDIEFVGISVFPDELVERVGS